MEFKDSLEEKQFVMEFNLRRRQLGLFQRVEVGYNFPKGSLHRCLEDIENDVERKVASIGATLGPIGRRERYLR